MIESIVEELGNNKYEYQYQTRYHNYYGSSKWGDWSGATRGYWYGESEVVENEEGKETCYYCGCSELMESEYGTEYRYCPDCFSDIMLEETHDPNQIEMFEDEKAWNESFGITDTEYEDISDNYDGSMKHKQIVNEYLTNYQKNK
jgi:hypothetical protein